MGRIHCPETSVKDYNSTLHNIPEERRSHIHRYSVKFFGIYSDLHFLMSNIAIDVFVNCHTCQHVSRNTYGVSLLQDYSTSINYIIYF
jgi:hypothetical protein